MIRLALKNPIAVCLICLLLVAFSAVVTPRMTVDTFPELTPPVLVVATSAPGLGPKDVEKTLTWRFEKYVSATPGVEHVQSVSRAGLSVIYVWLKWGTDLNAAQSLVQQQVQFAMSSVPKSLAVIPPFVLQYDPTNQPVLQVAVYGGGLTAPQLYDYAVNQIEPVLEGIGGVASASPNGGRERQINVVVDPAKAEALGVSSSEVGAAVARSNALLPSGRLAAKDLDANVYTNAVPKNVADIGDALVKLVDGRPVRIKDVARVEDGGTPETQAVSVNGELAVYLNVVRVPGGNILEIVDAAKARLATLENVPPGMQIEPIFDTSTFVRGTFSGLKTEILQAFFLVAMVILIFLQSWRSVLVAALTVPVAFAVILLVLYASGQTLNAFTLGGLTLAMGPLVDISVVVLESVHRRRALGESPYRAALQGTSDVAVAALAATLCTVAVLLPVVLLFGLAAKLFTPLAITVATGMFAGYAVSMTLTPIACRYLLGGHGPPPAFAVRIDAFVQRGAGAYVAALRSVLNVRPFALAIAFSLVGASAFVATRLPSTFFPELDESMERVYVRFAPGTSLQQADTQMRAMAKMLKEELPEGTVRLALTNTGSPSKARSAMNSPNAGPHMGFIRLQLEDPEHREETQAELAKMARTLLAQHYPGVDFLQAPGSIVASVFNNGYRAPGVIEIDGNDLDELSAASQAVIDVARTVPGLRDPYANLETSYPELHLETDRLTAGMVGVSARAAAQATLEATLGNINAPSVWVDASNGQAYYVVTYYDGDVVHDRDSLAQTPVRVSSAHGALKLGSYGTLERRVGPIAIERNNAARVATVFFATERRDLGSVAADLERALASDARTKHLSLRFVGQVDLMRTTFGGLGVAVALAIAVVFVVMASQFKSMRLPLVMLFTIPMCLIGIVVALLAAGQGLSITALMGVLMVLGIAMSNGILLVDHANRSFQAGTDRLDAILEAARVRVVPILMTSLATAIGLLPTALGLDPATAANRPLALAVVGGLISSTLLSLFVVPIMFTYLAKRAAADEDEPIVAVATAGT